MFNIEPSQSDLAGVCSSTRRRRQSHHPAGFFATTTKVESGDVVTICTIEPRKYQVEEPRLMRSAEYAMPRIGLPMVPASNAE
jgi:hypothetical protein